MFKSKFFIISFIFFTLLVITSTIKNETRILEKKISSLSTKILIKQKNLNEAQLEFHYLTSPKELEKKINILGVDNYQPINYSKIFFHISDFYNMQNKTSEHKNLNKEKF